MSKEPTMDVEEFVNTTEELELVKTTEGETYLKVGTKLYSTNSQEVQDMLTLAHRDMFSKFPKRSQVKDYVHHLEVLARTQESERQLHLRVAGDGENFWYDLGDAVVKTTTTGWEILESAPAYFRNYSNTLKQEHPRQNEIQLNDVLRFVNLVNNDDEILFQVYLVSCFIPGIAHPIPAFYGEKGAAKSTAMRVLRKLVDPAKQELMVLPRNQNELAQVFAHNYMPAFDNMDKLTPILSDMLCCAVTGGAINKRKLYTDSVDIILSFKSCVTINGVNLVATKSDLLDRSILFELERIDENNRQAENNFWERFQEIKPFLLGAIFDVLSGAMRIMNTTALSLETLPRMADFAKWGYAIAEVAGIGGNTFLQAYRHNIAKVNEEVIAEDPVAEAIVNFMARREEPWSGHTTKLLNILVDQNPTYNLPKIPNALSRHMKGIVSNLYAKGIECIFSNDTRVNKTLIELRRLNIIPVTPGGDEGNDNNEINDAGDNRREAIDNNGAGDSGDELAEAV